MRMLIASSALSAVLYAGQPAAMAQDNAPYCLKSGSGVATCIYQSVAECEQIKQSNDQCLRQEQVGGTVGAGEHTQQGIREPMGNTGSQGTNPPSDPPDRR